jgi:hypothetical protein
MEAFFARNLTERIFPPVARIAKHKAAAIPSRIHTAGESPTPVKPLNPATMMISAMARTFIYVNARIHPSEGWIGQNHSSTRSSESDNICDILQETEDEIHAWNPGFLEAGGA